MNRGKRERERERERGIIVVRGRLTTQICVLGIGVKRTFSGGARKGGLLRIGVKRTFTEGETTGGGSRLCVGVLAV